MVPRESVWKRASGRCLLANDFADRPPARVQLEALFENVPERPPEPLVEVGYVESVLLCSANGSVSSAVYSESVVFATTSGPVVSSEAVKWGPLDGLEVPGSLGRFGRPPSRCRRSGTHWRRRFRGDAASRSGR